MPCAWVTGHIASEPDIDYSNLPIFLIIVGVDKDSQAPPLSHIEMVEWLHWKVVRLFSVALFAAFLEFTVEG
jgi:hypothetical protein